jgi:hypothetical protein
MFNTKIPSRSAVAVLLVVAGSMGCAKDSKNATAHAERADETSGQITQTESLRATVQSVNEANRTVTMRDEEGHPFEVEAGESVDLSRLHPNDSVLVVYQESVAFALQDPSEADKSEEPIVEENSRRSVPGGVQFGRQIQTTVEIVSVAPDGAAATFRGPGGNVRTVQVADARNQQKVANLKPGDSVGVTYTERLAVDVDLSEK